MKRKNIRKDGTPIGLSHGQFREIGHRLVDELADLWKNIRDYPVTSGEQPDALHQLLPKEDLPEEGMDPVALMEETRKLLFEHSLYNGHPRFYGFITSSPAPIGMLADLLAAGINPNTGGQVLAPIATEIEKQCIRWISQFVGYPEAGSGVLVSGGNMANFTGFLTGRRQKGGARIREEGIQRMEKPLVVYSSAETHTWVQKAADLFGLGLSSIRWIPCNSRQQMEISELERAIKKDIQKGLYPVMVIGTAGTVSTGAVDQLDLIADVCEEHDLWFHVDGAYGAMAAALPELKDLFYGIHRADSVALDPHKWLYTPLEAGCTLVKDPHHLQDTFSFHPPYYHMGDEIGYHNYHEFGLQNSRGFRALKVWVALKQAGAKGYRQMIREDIELAKMMYEAADAHPEMEAFTDDLSIATFRYVPPQLAGQEEKLDRLNTILLEHLQAEGEVFLSNAVIDGKFVLRACIVNFNTRPEDVLAVPEIAVREGRKIFETM